MEEVRGAVAALQTNKALGDSWLSPELLKGHHDDLYAALALLLNAAVAQGVPEPWNRLTLHSIHKKGDKSVASNYRGIAVMSLLPKLLAQVLLQRLDVVSSARQLRAPV